MPLSATTRPPSGQLGDLFLDKNERLWFCKGGMTWKQLAEVSNLVEYAGVCGWGLAPAHVRSGVPAMISGYLGQSDRFDEAVVGWAAAYTDQTERDHARLLAANLIHFYTADRGPHFAASEQPDLLPRRCI